MAIVHGDYKILYIKIGGDFKPVGCLTENSFSETTGTIDTTTRENTDGWGSVAPTNQGYSIPFSGVNTLDDNEGSIADYDALQNLKRTRSVIEWQIRSGQGGSVESGTGLLTDLSNSAPVGGEVTFSGTITGSGLPVSTPQAAGDPPTNFRNSDPATTNCFVEWDKSITGAMQSYRVYQAGVLFREFIGDVDQGTLTGLVPGTTYSNMTCRGFDGVEETPDSNIISFTTASQASISVIDNLLSNSATDALSANQGRILNESKVSTIQEGANVTVDATDPINPIVASIQRPVVDNLNSTSATQSLSANQGRILNTTKLNTVYAGSNVTVDKTDPLAPIISSVPGTSAGTTRRVYFTGDPLILSETFYETNGANKGTVASIQQQVTNGDDQTTFFAVDFIGAAAEGPETLVGGNYTGHLEMEVDNNAGNQRYDIEIYLTDAQGIPFNSGITNAPIGDLGVELLALGTTGVFDVEDDNPTSVVYVFSLNENIDIIAGTRVRYHISATKVGTDGGNVVMSLYSGYDWTAYLDAPASVTTEGVVNSDDTITGATQYDVNRSVQANKMGLEGGEDYRMTGAIVGGEETERTTAANIDIKTTVQMAGFLTYQLVESFPNSEIFVSNEGLGEHALELNEGSNCVALGLGTLYANTGDNVVAVGNSAGENNSGTACSFYGYYSGRNNTGIRSSFTGELSGESNQGNYGAGFGPGSLSKNLGDNNVGVGVETLYASSGDNNTAVGYRAGTLPTPTDAMVHSNTISLGNNSLPTQDNQAVIGDDTIESVRVGNPDYVATNDADLVPKSQTAISTLSGEMTGASKSDNQVIISDTDYGDGSTAVAGTLYFIKP